MRGWALAIVLAAGCGGDRIEECDAMVATVEKVTACNRLDATQRAQIEQTMGSIEDALDRIGRVGTDRIPPELLGEARRTCAKQAAEVRQLYEKVAPECLR